MSKSKIALFSGQSHKGVSSQKGLLYLVASLIKV